MTDELVAYGRIGRRFASHETVNHSAEEYVRGSAHINTVEGYFSIFHDRVECLRRHVLDLDGTSLAAALDESHDRNLVFVSRRCAAFSASAG